MVDATRIARESFRTWTLTGVAGETQHVQVGRGKILQVLAGAETGLIVSSRHPSEERYPGEHGIVVTRNGQALTVEAEDAYVTWPAVIVESGSVQLRAFSLDDPAANIGGPPQEHAGWVEQRIASLNDNESILTGNDHTLFDSAEAGVLVASDERRRRYSRFVIYLRQQGGGNTDGIRLGVDIDGTAYRTLMFWRRQDFQADGSSTTNKVATIGPWPMPISPWRLVWHNFSVSTITVRYIVELWT